MFVIEVDYRENSLKERIETYINNSKLNNVFYKNINLSLGDVRLVEITNQTKYSYKDNFDYVFENEYESIEKNVVYIFERKALTDLATSIRDGRYKEQSFRLNELQTHNHNIMYLIEGDFNRYYSKFTKISKQTLYSAIASINVFKGFSVYHTQSVDQSAEFLCCFCLKLIKEFSLKKTMFYENNNIIIQNIHNENENNDISNNETVVESNLENEIVETKNINNDIEYIKTLKKKKCDHITPDNIDVLLLMQVPGIQHKTAVVILEHFDNSFYQMIRELKDDTSKLYSIYTLTKNNKKIKLRRNIIDNIHKYLIKSIPDIINI